MGNGQSITVSTTGGFTTGEVYQGVGAAKSNGNISAVGSATPTFSSALTADRHGVVGENLQFLQLLSELEKNFSV